MHQMRFFARRLVLSALGALGPLGGRLTAWSAESSLCLQESAIAGAYESPCMRLPARTLEFPGVDGSLTIEQGEVAAGSTGAAVWSAGLFLASTIAGEPELCRGKSVVEVGCGTGLCGILAARVGARRVVLTDSAPSVLARAGRNVQLNRVVGATTRPLLWGSVLDDEMRGAFDVVLASDVLYFSSGWRPLAQTAYELLAPGGSLVLVEAGHESLSAAAAVGGFTAVAEGCGLAVEAPIALGDGVRDALLVTARRRV